MWLSRLVDDSATVAALGGGVERLVDALGARRALDYHTKDERPKIDS
jgi:hypothetical protein